MLRLLLLLVLLLTSVSAGAQEEPGEEQPASPPADETSANAQELPSDPADRLQMAEAAFRRADYGLLVPLLEPLEVNPSPFNTVDERVQARELLIVGYFFQAQKVTASADRDELLQKARSVSLELLRDRPDHALDTLVFPASVVDLFEAVRRDNATELEEILAKRQEQTQNGNSQTVYIERSVTRHPGWVNFLPFGAGQFQNEQLIKGTVFAILQGAGLVVNGFSYWQIVRLTSSGDTPGTLSTEGDLDSDFARAKRWRQTLYGGLAGFGVAWAVSILDGWLNYDKETVRIRSLDAPPPELGGDVSDAGLRSLLRLGLTVELRW